MWTAVTLWIVSAAGAAAYALIAADGLARGESRIGWLLGAPIAYFGVVLALCALYFAIGWLWRARRPPDVRIGARATLRLLWREYVTLAGAAPRMMLYRWLVPDAAPARIDVPVLLLHGVLCNAGVWHRMARHLRKRGVAGLYSLSYGPPLASIDAFVEQLAQKLDAMLAETGARSAVIIAHSMGGLVARAYIRKYGAANVARVLTIGTPHHGSMHAWLMIGTALAQLRPGNAWLAQLNGQRIDPSVRIVSLWSWHDSMVAPQTSCELPGAVDVPIIGVGHKALLRDEQVLERAYAEITGARAQARRAD
jgi:triacylglycerol esterase/lipase EstA (alpha/beta hydrolase family)